jgi:PDDEXK-like domain of unknown function (DUF3799)
MTNAVLADIQPGVYEDMPADVYHGDTGSLSSSGARKLLPPSCPALFKYEVDNPPPPKPHFDLGNTAHKLVLGVGPELELIEYERWDTKAAKAAVAEARERGAIPLKPDAYHQVHAMADALRSHPWAGRLFQPGTGRPELSLFWHDGPTGVTRRARLDWAPDPGTGRLIIPDYKTCRSAEPGALERAMYEYGYHQQADWYRAGAQAVELADRDAEFVFVCQETRRPYLVTVFQPDTMAMRIAAARNRRAIQTYAECVETGHWPGHTDDVAYLSLPPWAENHEIQEYLT